MGLCKPQLEAVRLLQNDNQMSNPDAKVLHKLPSTLMPLRKGEGGNVQLMSLMYYNLTLSFPGIDLMKIISSTK